MAVHKPGRGGGCVYPRHSMPLPPFACACNLRHPTSPCPQTRRAKGFPRGTQGGAAWLAINVSTQVLSLERRRSCFTLLSQVRVDAAQSVIDVACEPHLKVDVLCHGGCQARHTRVGCERACNRKHRLVVALLGFFGEESHIICGLQRKEISSGGKYSLLTQASESGGWTVADKDREDTASNWLTSQRKATIC